MSVWFTLNMVLQNALNVLIMLKIIKYISTAFLYNDLTFKMGEREKGMNEELKKI